MVAAKAAMWAAERAAKMVAMKVERRVASWEQQMDGR